MRRGLKLLVAAAMLTSTLAVWNTIRAVAKRKREIGYTAALKAYSDALHPGITRKDVEDYLHLRNARFTWTWTAFGGRRENQYADLVKIGEETAPWYCSEEYVYVAFEFLLVSQTDSDVLQRIEIYRPDTGCL